MRRLAAMALAGLLSGASHADTFKASGWTVSADARGNVKVSGNVRGPRCALLRLDIFTAAANGYHGHVVTMVENVSASRKFFDGADAVHGGSGRPKVISVYARCAG